MTTGSLTDYFIDMYNKTCYYFFGGQSDRNSKFQENEMILMNKNDIITKINLILVSEKNRFNRIAKRAEKNLIFLYEKTGYGFYKKQADKISQVYGEDMIFTPENNEHITLIITDLQRKIEVLKSICIEIYSDSNIDSFIHLDIHSDVCSLFKEIDYFLDQQKIYFNIIKQDMDCNMLR